VIYVDKLRAWPPKPGAERYFGNGKLSCHLTTDGPIEELHQFAVEQLGLKGKYFQKHPRNAALDHYDLTPPMRAKALRRGAREKPEEEILEQLGLFAE
jgi:hypothetical protein